MPNTPVPDELRQDPIYLTNPDPNAWRDPERTPMQWDTSTYAGFSTAAPWLPIGETLAKNNVKSQQGEHDSFYRLYQRLLRIRSSQPILRQGSLETFGEQNGNTFTFARRLGDEHVYVALNFSGKSQKVSLPHVGRVLCATHPVDYPDITDNTITLRPYEGVLVECSSHPLNMSSQ
jgi:alpha-glucosidase